ncbi:MULTISPECIES: hypothetical protein [unclassified Rhodanobacter]|uniref:Uncharacterized protein n=1 Tax=Rhodanobacter humi TaxID=1888173 RepID=A0ABV4APD6_9GAMM
MTVNTNHHEGTLMEPSFSIRNIEELNSVVTEYYQDAKRQTEEFFLSFDDLNLRNCVKAVINFQEITSPFSVFFNQWNYQNGWYQREVEAFLKGKETTKKDKPPRHLEPFNQTVGQKFEDVLDDLHNCCGMFVNAPDTMEVNLMLRKLFELMTCVDACLKVLNDSFLKYSWYEKALFTQSGAGKSQKLVMKSTGRKGYTP